LCSLRSPSFPKWRPFALPAFVILGFLTFYGPHLLSVLKQAYSYFTETKKRSVVAPVMGAGRASALVNSRNSMQPSVAPAQRQLSAGLGADVRKMWITEIKGLRAILSDAMLFL
jgi:hypothetical protein